MSKLRDKILPHIRRYGDILRDGEFLAVDPSCGSSSSMPAYALFQCGELVESGELVVPVHYPLHVRLGMIGEGVRQYFPDIELMLMEGVPNAARRGRKFGINMSNQAHASLVQGIGAIVGNSPCEPVVYVDARLWHMYKPPGYVKSDVGDAEQIGYCALEILSELESSGEWVEVV